MIHLSMGGWSGRPGKRAFFLSQVRGFQSRKQKLLGFVAASGGKRMTSVLLFIFLLIGHIGVVVYYFLFCKLYLLAYFG